MVVAIDELVALSTRHRHRRCKIAEALAELDEEGRGVIEEAIARPDVTDGAVTTVLQRDTKAMADAVGPQSVTFHRSKRCICFDTESEVAS